MDKDKTFLTGTSEPELDNPEHGKVICTRQAMSFTGYIMLVVAVGLLIFLAYQYFQTPIADAPREGQSLTAWILQFFTDDILIFAAAVFLVGVGMRLLGGTVKTPTVIPPEDRELLEPLITAANRDAIGQYVVLSRLSGFAGSFHKVGFSSLPLATGALTLIFSILSFFETQFLELAKLTLGAFIGSFVQRAMTNKTEEQAR